MPPAGERGSDAGNGAASVAADPEAGRQIEAQAAFEQWEAAFAGGSATTQEEWKQVAKGLQPRILVDGLEYLGVHTRVTGKDEYTFSLLFRATKDLTTDYHFALDAYAWGPNLQSLPEPARKQGMVKFHRRVHENPTAGWKQGEFQVLQVKAETPAIPLNLYLLAFSPTADVFWNHVGTRLPLGWQWAASDPEAFIKRVSATKTAAELYALAPAGPRLAPAVTAAVDVRWQRLTEGHDARPVLDGLEFYSINTRKTGEKEYTFDLLLKSTARLEKDYIFTLIGEVDPGHLQFIKPAKPDGSYASWHIDTRRDSMTAWEPGTYHVAQLKIQTEIIPYNVSFWLSPLGADGKWDWSTNSRRVDVGWQADLAK